MTAGRTSAPPVNRVLERVFAPMHKRALGTAVGATAGLLIFAVTVFHLLVIPSEPTPVRLLAQYFYGYDISWRGAFVGAWWGLVSGFAAGWFVAFLRNLAVATWILVIRTRAAFSQANEFLDHI